MLITAAMLIFSCVGPFVRAVALPVSVIICCTSGAAAVLLLLWFLLRRDAGSLHIKGQRRWLLLSACSLFGNVFCYFQAYRLTTMANTVITHYTAPVFAALLAPLLLGEKWERVTGIALLISTVGLFLIAGDVAPGQAHLAGAFLGLASGFFYGFSIVIGKKLLRSLRPPVIMMYQCAVIACVALPFTFVEPWGLTAGKVLGLGLYSLLVCLLAAGLYLRGLRHVEAQHAGILAYSELLFVVLLGVLVGETPGLSVLAGGCLIAVSGYIVLRAESLRA